MIKQNRFIVVYTSTDGKLFNRAVVFDNGFLNAALIGKSQVLGGGAAITRAINIVHEINNLRGEYTATMREYKEFNEIPEKINITTASKLPRTVLSGSAGELNYIISGSRITIYTDPSAGY